MTSRPTTPQIERPAGCHDDRRDRGATLVFVALALPVLLIMTAFAVDLGTQRSNRRTMQARADIVALDMVRIIQGRDVATIVADPATLTALQESAARNDITVDLAGTGDPFDPRITLVEWGTWSQATDSFTPMSNGFPDAVRIKAEQRNDYRFQPGSGDVTRRAVATTDAQARLTLGSFAARVSSGQSPFLNPIVGDALNGTAGGYEGLADSDVRGDEIAPYLPSGSTGAGTPEEVLDAEVTLDELYLATAQALRNDPDATQEDLANADVLEQQALAVPAMPPVRFGDVIAAEQGAEAAALDSEVNVLDLFAASAMLANGDSAIEVPQAGFSLPGLATLGTPCDQNSSNDATEVCSAITVIQKPVSFTGRAGANASTSQARIRTGLDASNIAGLGLTGATVQVDVRVATGFAEIASVTCGTPRTIAALISTGLLEVDLRVNGSVSVTVPLLGTATVPVTITGTRPPSQSTETAVFTEQPDGSFDPPSYEAGTQDLGLDNLTLTTVTGPTTLGSAVSTILNGTVTPFLVGTLLPIVESELLIPIMNSLGLNVSGADVAANAIGCTLPRLATDPQ